jgi:cytochrome b561
MRLWIPKGRSATLVHIAAWVVFLVLTLIGLLLEKTNTRLNPAFVFLTMPLAFLVFFPAVSIVSARSQLTSDPPAGFLKKWWNTFFAGTPPYLAIAAIAYFYLVSFWIQGADVLGRIRPGPVDSIGTESVGFFAVSSLFALLAAVILWGHARSSLPTGGRV